MAYTTDSDLQKIEADIFTYGIETAGTWHDETADDINRMLHLEWFPKASKDYISGDYQTIDFRDFDPDRIKNPEKITKMAAYWLLGNYFFPALSKFSDPPDTYERKAEFYMKQYEQEKILTLGTGIDYDFSGDGELDDSERISQRGPRMAIRG